MADEYICELVSHGNGLWEYEPTGDEIVHCKDCKWAVRTIGGKLKYCKKHDPTCINKLYYDMDFFCRDGERKEDG